MAVRAAVEVQTEVPEHLQAATLLLPADRAV